MFDVVQVDVSVLDQERQPVRGLTQRDFTILEDGKARPLVAFVPVELAEVNREQPSAPWVRDVAPDVTTNRARPEGRLVVIMLDWSIRFEDLSPIVPTTRRDFARTDRVSAFVRVYQKASEAPQSASVNAQIIDVNGRAVTTDAASFDADQFTRNRGADYRIRLPVDRLASGEYLFTLDATRAQNAAHRSVRFRVQ